MNTILNLNTEASLEQYSKKIDILLGEMEENYAFALYSESGLKIDLEELQDAIRRARILKNCSVSVDIRLIRKIDQALEDWIEEK